MKSRSMNDFSLKDNPMILNNDRPGYDPDQYDDEPSDYVNSETAYTADDLAEFGKDDDDLDEDGDVLENEEDEFDDSDVDEDDPINDDVTDYPETEPAARHEEKKPVYIKDMPYIDHATPGVTSN